MTTLLGGLYYKPISKKDVTDKKIKKNISF